MESWKIHVRVTHPDDLDAIGDIYAHYVENSVATFELARPDRAEWDRRFDAVVTAGSPFSSAFWTARSSVTPTAPRGRPAPRTSTPWEDSIYVAPLPSGMGWAASCSTHC